MADTHSEAIIAWTRTVMGPANANWSKCVKNKTRRGVLGAVAQLRFRVAEHSEGEHGRDLGHMQPE